MDMLELTWCVVTRRLKCAGHEGEVIPVGTRCYADQHGRPWCVAAGVDMVQAGNAEFIPVDMDHPVVIYSEWLALDE